MSADLRIDDLMQTKIPEPESTEAANVPVTANPPAGFLARRLKTVMLVIIGLGALGGGLIAYLVVTAEKRPEVDTSGKSMNVVIGDKNNSPVDAKARLEAKLANPNVLTNYFESHPPKDAEHPLLPSIEVARRGLEYGRKHIRDYTAVMHKQERIGKKLMPKEVVEIKIRHDGVATGLNQSPLSVYVKFLAPKAMAGREVIWRKGHNNDKLTVHEYVFGRNIQLNLAPDGMLARRGNRYPITEIGFETLAIRMIEKGTRDLQHDECDVKIDRAASINGRDCTLIEITHPVKRDYFEFYIARIFMDDELNIPIRYAAYSWPEQEGGEPVLEEEYTFTDVKLNVGLTDLDFDPKNPAYNFPN